MARKPKPRPTTTQRGYGAAHQRERAKWAPLVATGTVQCWRCRRYIGVNEAWDLGHDDHDRSVYRGPEHIKCNRATSGRKKSRRRSPGAVVASRDW